jgi:hypothetical protein
MPPMRFQARTGTRRGRSAATLKGRWQSEPDSTELVGLLASIGKSIDEETDRARRDEGRSWYERRGDS